MPVAVAPDPATRPWDLALRRAALAAVAAGLLGALLAMSPPYLTDRILLLPRSPERPVLLATLPPGAAPGAWSHLAAAARARGAVAVGLVGRDPPVVEGTASWRPTDSPTSGLGIPLDADGRARRWQPQPDGEPSFPARLLAAAGVPVPEGVRRIPTSSIPLPTLAQAQVASLDAGALEGRIVLVGPVDPWASPMVDTPDGPVPVAALAARLVAGPAPVVAPAWLCALLAALLAAACEGLLRLASTRWRLPALVGVTLACLLPAFVLPALGAVLPVEPLLGAPLLVAAASAAGRRRAIAAEARRLADLAGGRAAAGPALPARPSAGPPPDPALADLAVHLDRIADQRDLLLAATTGSRVARLLFSTRGHPLLLDDRARALLARLGLPEPAPLEPTLAALGLPADLPRRAMEARSPLRATPRIPGWDAWIYPCVHRDAPLGVGLDLVDVQGLQAQDAVKSALLEMVSYRVHNILAAIRGYAELLGEGAVEPGEAASRIAARCGEMAGIFDRYEDVARSPEGGRPEPVPLLALVQDVVAGARRVLGEDRVRLADAPVALPPALAEPNDLTRALMGLVLDTGRDLPPDEPVVVGLRADLKALEVRVRAGRRGPPLDLLRRLAAGPGDQGAPLARRLVEAMGGRFEVEGGGEDGALYRIILPEG